jgi:hypothetical protein
MRSYWDCLADDGWLPKVPPGEPLPSLADASLRLLARAQLDALVARDVFGLSLAEMEFVLDTFPLVRRTEEKLCGEFRSRNLILEFFAGAKSAPD